MVLSWLGGSCCCPSWLPASCWIFLWPSGTAGSHTLLHQAGQVPCPTARTVGPSQCHCHQLDLTLLCPSLSCSGVAPGGAGARCGVGLALTGPSAPPRHVHTTCLGCSELSCVPQCHHVTATPCAPDAPSSAASLGDSTAQPHHASGMLRAQLCPSMAPWHVPSLPLSPWGLRGRFSACPGTAPLPFREQLPPRGQQGGRWHRASEGPRARAARHTGGGPAPCAGCRSQTVV